MELVHLVDAGDDLGGCMRWITRLPGLGEWGHVIDYRRVQFDAAPNARVRARHAAGCRRRAATTAPQIVVVATGARWSADGLERLHAARRSPAPDASLAHVLTPEQVMVEGKRPPGRRVAVVDYEGYFTGAGLAELLAAEGHEVTLVTCFDVVAPYCDQTLEGYRVRERLHELGVDAHRGVTVTAIDPRAASSPTASSARRLDARADAVVLSRSGCPMTRSTASSPRTPDALEREPASRRSTGSATASPRG